MNPEKARDTKLLKELHEQIGLKLENIQNCVFYASQNILLNFAIWKSYKKVKYHCIYLT